jgi:hypothetical protein
LYYYIRSLERVLLLFEIFFLVNLCHFELIEEYTKITEKGNDTFLHQDKERTQMEIDQIDQPVMHGYWKAIGADKTINDTSNIVIGFKKSLVFYEGKAPGGRKSHWIMHEYRVNGTPRRKKTYADDMRVGGLLFHFSIHI